MKTPLLYCIELNLMNEKVSTYSTLCIAQAAGSDMTVIAFLIFPARTNNFNIESLRGQAIAKQLRDTVNHIQSQIGKRLFEKSLR